MLRAAFACLLALCPCAALAEDSVQVWLDPGFFSYHFSDADFRQDNYGVGVGVFVAPEHGFLAGTFLNSSDERSHYAAYHWRPWGRTTGDLSVRAGFAFGAIDGYSNTNNGGWFPVILPALTAEYGHFGAHLNFPPPPRRASPARSTCSASPSEPRRASSRRRPRRCTAIPRCILRPRSTGEKSIPSASAPATTRASAAPRPCSSTTTASTRSTSRSCAYSTPTARECTAKTGAWCPTSSCRPFAARTSPFSATAARRAASATSTT